MNLPINVNDLLHGKSVEWERLEFKAGWNLLAVLHTLCAFANDFHNLGGGYVIIGVAEQDGLPVLPPIGLAAGELDAIQKEILNLGHNAIYHRSYEEREPVEVRVSAEELVVLSYPGPDRSVRLDQLRLGRAVSRRYRNRRIGAFLKELEITEGRSTGIPKILDAMKRNGSPPPDFEFDPDHSYFMTRLPAHPQSRTSESELNAAEQVAGEVAGEVGQLLKILLAGLMTRKEMQSSLRLKGQAAAGNAGRPVRFLFAPFRTVLLGNLSLDELGQQNERFLPAQIASLGRYDRGNSFLHDAQFSPTRNLLQGNGHLHYPRQVRIVKAVRVADALRWNQLEILTTEGMAFAGGEVGERHFEAAADLGLQVVNLAGESIGREPFSHGVRIQERPIDSFWLGAQDAVESDRVGCHSQVFYSNGTKPFDLLIIMAAIIGFTVHQEATFFKRAQATTPLG